jgi:hypothetical protein
LGFTRSQLRDPGDPPIHNWFANSTDLVGGVSKCVIGGNIEDGITIELTAPDYEADFLSWTKNVPPWIKLQRTDVETGDLIREVGTDGNIDQV